MARTKIEVRSPDLEGFVPQDDEVPFPYDLQEKKTISPDILRSLASFLVSVADYYDHRRKDP